MSVNGVLYNHNKSIKKVYGGRRNEKVCRF